MNAKCGTCGKDFRAQRSTAKYCSSSCRAKASTRRNSTAALAAVVPMLEWQPPEPAPIAQVSGAGLVESVRGALERAETLDSWQGQQALILAARLATPGESGAAALSKELERMMTALVPPDTSDELDTIQDEVAHARRRRRA